MIRLKTILTLCLLAAYSLQGQLIKDAVPGDYTPTTPEKYTNGITNPGAHIQNTTLPLEAEVTLDSGKKVKLAELFNGDKPALLCMVYFTCRSTCGPLINDIYNKIKDINLKPGKDYNLIFLSMESKETVDVAQGKKTNYLKEFTYEAGEGHHFVTASKESISAITKALDFKFVAISETSDYSHPTVTYYVTPQGKISRFITGFGFNPQDIRLSLLDAGQGKIGSILDNALLRCYRFDPKNKTYVRNSMMLMSVAGAMTLISLALFLGFLWYHEFKNKSKATT
jgi:protein SCO1